MEQALLVRDNFSMTEFNSKKPKRGFYFREWRKFRGLNQEALADMIGLTPSSISQLETGKQGFTDKTLLAIAQALDCHPGDLLTRDPSRADSFWPLFEKAERLVGPERTHAMNVIRAALRIPAEQG